MVTIKSIIQPEHLKNLRLNGINPCIKSNFILSKMTKYSGIFYGQIGIMDYNDTGNYEATSSITIEV